MADELRMPVDAVLRHAGTVDAAADAVETGRAAAAHVQLGHESYGQICGFLPGLIGPLGDKAVTALGGSALALRETADRLRTAARAVQAADDAAARDLRRLS